MFWDFWCWALGALQENEEGELSLGMAEEPAESSGVKGGQGEVMFYWEMRGSDPADRSSLRLEFADFRGGLEPP